MGRFGEALARFDELDDRQGLDRLLAIASRPVGVWDLTRAIRALPVLDVMLTDSPGGRDLGNRIRTRRHGVPLGRLAVATLRIPDDFEDYLRGGSRQWLRTGLNNAKKAGIWCAEVEGVTERIEVATNIVRSRSFCWEAHSMPYIEQLLRSPSARMFRALDADGSTLGATVVGVDGPWAEVRLSVTTGRGSGSVARFPLHLAVMKMLQTIGVQYLISGSLLDMPSSLRTSLGRLGFLPMNLRLLPGNAQYGSSAVRVAGAPPPRSVDKVDH
jgi:hypothetical protein